MVIFHCYVSSPEGKGMKLSVRNISEAYWILVKLWYQSFSSTSQSRPRSQTFTEKSGPPGGPLVDLHLDSQHHWWSPMGEEPSVFNKTRGLEMTAMTAQLPGADRPYVQGFYQLVDSSIVNPHSKDYWSKKLCTPWQLRGVILWYFRDLSETSFLENPNGFVWKCWVNIPNEIAIFHRDNDH